MQKFIDLTTSSPEPELPKARPKIAPKVGPQPPLKDISQNFPRPPTVQLFDYSFASFDDVASTRTAKTPISDPSKNSNHPKASKSIELDDSDEIQIRSDDFDTKLGSVLNDTPAKRNPGFWKRDQKDNVPVDLTKSDDPFTSPPPAKRRKASPPNGKVPRAASGYKRTVSNIESIDATKVNQHKYSLNRSKSTGADPILFTSSPDASAKRLRKGKGKAFSRYYEDEDEDEDEIEVPRKKVSKPDPLDIDDSDEDFPSIENLKSWSPPPKKTKTLEEPMAHYYDEDSTPEKKQRKKHGDKALSVAEKRAAKEAEKEQKRIDKEYAKAEKEREKEKAKNLAKVNIDRTKPEISTPEMIVDLPSCIQDKSNMALRTRIDILLKECSVEQSQSENTDIVIKWSRKVTSRYNKESDIWEPTPLDIQHEKHVLCVIPAKKFIDMVLGRGDVDLDTHVAILKSQTESPESCELIYIFEGLTAWQNKNRNIKDRQYKEAVRSRIPEDEAANTSSSQRRRAAQADEYVANADDTIEDALLTLEVLHKAKYMLTVNAQDTAKWILQFTKHISTIPYLDQREALGLNFCMATGQFKSGKDATDTYIKMLEEIHHVTPNMAEGIVVEYPTPQALLQGFKEDGQFALEECRKTANKNGALTDAKIGKKISQRVYKIFTEKDPGWVV